MPILLAASGAAQAQSTIKPGLWESKIVRMTMDGKDALAQMNAAQEQMRQAFAKMPPEQRKKMEAMMPAQSGDSGTHRICISPEMVAKDGALVPALSVQSVIRQRFPRAATERVLKPCASRWEAARRFPRGKS
ncbi:hypothetical protein [Ottowia sp. VDI28]|uniref:hypothetical protein n=1 Tax=Ottowia sp. VDI28 TaxID=3133968 RepID=UPI003C2C7720